VKRSLANLRPVYVAGIGLHAYQASSTASYVALGLTAARAALSDSGLPWSAVEASFVGTATLGIAGGRAMLKHLGPNDAPILHVENASASGSAAFRQACIEVASGLVDVAIAVGVDKPAIVAHAYKNTGAPNLVGEAIALPTHFALVASEYAAAHRLTAADLAVVAVKNHSNGAKNPFAQRRKARTLDEVLASRPIAGLLTALQCCPIGEGAAAAIVVSQAALQGSVKTTHAVRVASSVTASETVNDLVSYDATLSGITVRRALSEAQVSAEDIDVVELHDAFSVEELLYIEAMGLAAPGQAAHAVRAGEFDIGGRCAVSPSGGLLAMGHPTGPTGVGQVVEIVRQLRSEAIGRQQPAARLGLAHMCGLGTVCYAHVLIRE
jgi:acetyl-CoA acetyltransferase